jgi:AcrR family transcriptional regulator
MNGHEKRRQRIRERILQNTLELFKIQGVDQVSMDEIAAKAAVSKVTIYKYFHSKEALQREVIKRYIDEIMAATEKALDSQMDIIEKLKIIMLTEANAPQLADSQALSEILETDDQSLKNQIRGLMHKIYEQGKREGYIAENLSFELLDMYAEILRAGFKAKLMDLEPILNDPVAFEQLLNLFFFGFIKNKNRTL